MISAETVELLRVLRAVRRMLQTGRATRLAPSLHAAAGRGHADSVLAALRWLDDAAWGMYGATVLDLEDRNTTSAEQLIGIFDRAIGALEASRDRRQQPRMADTLAA